MASSAADIARALWSSVTTAANKQHSNAFASPAAAAAAAAAELLPTIMPLLRSLMRAQRPTNNNGSSSLSCSSQHDGISMQVAAAEGEGEFKSAAALLITAAAAAAAAAAATTATTSSTSSASTTTSLGRANSNAAAANSAANTAFRASLVVDALLRTSSDAAAAAATERHAAVPVMLVLAAQQFVAAALSMCQGPSDSSIGMTALQIAIATGEQLAVPEFMQQLEQQHQQQQQQHQQVAQAGEEQHVTTSGLPQIAAAAEFALPQPTTTGTLPSTSATVTTTTDANANANAWTSQPALAWLPDGIIATHCLRSSPSIPALKLLLEQIPTATAESQSILTRVLTQPSGSHSAVGFLHAILLRPSPAKSAASSDRPEALPWTIASSELFPQVRLHAAEALLNHPRLVAARHLLAEMVGVPLLVQDGDGDETTATPAFTYQALLLHELAARNWIEPLRLVLATFPDIARAQPADGLQCLLTHRCCSVEALQLVLGRDPNFAELASPKHSSTPRTLLGTAMCLVLPAPQPVTVASLANFVATSSGSTASTALPSPASSVVPPAAGDMPSSTTPAAFFRSSGTVDFQRSFLLAAVEYGLTGEVLNSPNCCGTLLGNYRHSATVDALSESFTALEAMVAFELASWKSDWVYDITSHRLSRVLHFLVRTGARLSPIPTIKLLRRFVRPQANEHVSLVDCYTLAPSSSVPNEHAERLACERALLIHLAMMPSVTLSAFECIVDAADIGPTWAEIQQQCTDAETTRLEFGLHDVMNEPALFERLAARQLALCAEKLLRLPRLIGLEIDQPDSAGVTVLHRACCLELPIPDVITSLVSVLHATSTLTDILAFAEIAANSESLLCPGCRLCVLPALSSNSTTLPQSNITTTITLATSEEELLAPAAGDVGEAGAPLVSVVKDSEQPDSSATALLRSTPKDNTNRASTISLDDPTDGLSGGKSLKRSSSRVSIAWQSPPDPEGPSIRIPTESRLAAQNVDLALQAMVGNAVPVPVPSNGSSSGLLGGTETTQAQPDPSNAQRLAAWKAVSLAFRASALHHTHRSQSACKSSGLAWLVRLLSKRASGGNASRPSSKRVSTMMNWNAHEFPEYATVEAPAAPEPVVAAAEPRLFNAALQPTARIEPAAEIPPSLLESAL
ncbi:hypothetical protein CAOG_02228 [Capsaspora owczarzaki ATCC 30864]|uniref:Uncharacterized protein n=1 Tax=Capsaspora owczarzaki (strain ATCC 30864) TaxID=595528 RepID=A0A0D2WKW3_CAPO3|nr:hypothetical protein CAOG_02228 [Capsaspora owczarzaki ATCC 30864]KJE91025.1 hypothetical protein CAOG_002228 [Capsaspora owczarzaki ATCC 30864]|eukprot:XP_004348978.2 hypothetical protein CAOG_02228 [Capsaspora owczarzaki ATCC 30864]